MKRVDAYRQQLRAMDDWDAFLLQESGLPGPRGNIELARAVADEGEREHFTSYLSNDPDSAPTNSPYEFLAFCGVLGQGRLLVEGDEEALEILHTFASDPRWRVREAVAMALQRFGGSDMDALLKEMAKWSRGNRLEQRAAAAGLCEPALLGEAVQVERVLGILDRITASMLAEKDRRSGEFQALRKGLGYCWSVAVVALPRQGKAFMEKWLGSDDRDVQWVMKQNLRKKRLERMDPEWVRYWRGELGI
ncbi:HEAT repeat domain-containing protein [Chloroflexota bacterium]